jgi:hypothetical protein
VIDGGVGAAGAVALPTALVTLGRGEGAKLGEALPLGDLLRTAGLLLGTLLRAGLLALAEAVEALDPLAALSEAV